MKLQNFLEVFRLFSFRKKAKWLLNLLNVYWDHSQSVHPGAVTWCVGEDGELFVYTRGEYAGQILNSVKTITSGIKNHKDNLDKLKAKVERFCERDYEGDCTYRIHYKTVQELVEEAYHLGVKTMTEENDE